MMQEIRDTLVSVNGGASTSSNTSRVGTGTGRAPRTSFAYSSRPLSQSGGGGSGTHAASSTVLANDETSRSISDVASAAPAFPVGPAVSTPPQTSQTSARCSSTPHASASPPRPGEATTASPSAFSPAPSPSSFAEVSASVFSRMDESQVRAATYPVDATLLLQAGAGSGKTQTMAARIVYLLEHGVAARSILGICFTRQAAETLRERVRTTLPAHLARQAHFLKLKTFHAFGLECLRRFSDLPADVHVLDARQQHRLARQVVEAHARRERSAEAVTALVEHVNWVKTMKVPPIPQSDPNVQDAYLFPFYQKMLHEEHNAVDFGDLQQMFYELLRPVAAAARGSDPKESDPLPAGSRKEGEEEPTSTPASTAASADTPPSSATRLVPSFVCTALRQEFTHFVVDEFQDFNEIQVELLALLAGDACRVTCVGDPNQCIYTWRGAIPNVFGVWKKRFPQSTMLTLAMNYRSDGPIVDAANRVVKATQLPYYHREERAVTLVHCLAEDDELQAVPLVIDYVLRRRDPHMGYGDIAILCRTRRRVQLYCDVLRAQRIPVRELTATAIDRLSTMRSFLAFLRLCVSPHSPEGNSDVRTVLSLAPLHRLPAGAAKKFFLSLDAVCQERRQLEAAQIQTWRHTIDATSRLNDESTRESPRDPVGRSYSNSSRGQPEDSSVASLHHRTGVPGVHPETYSFFAVLQELVYHNFSCDAFPKLEVSKKSQKSVRQVVQLVLHVRGMLAQPSCDAEQVLRYVLQEGGYESDSMTAVATRKATAAASAGNRKRARESSEKEGTAPRSGYGGPHGSVGARLMDQCTAQYNHQTYQSSQSNPCASAGVPSLPPTPSRGAAAAITKSNNNNAYDDDVLPPEEEAAVWEEERMNLSELVLYTCHEVQEAVQNEVARQLEGRAAATKVKEEDSHTASAASQTPVSNSRTLETSEVWNLDSSSSSSPSSCFSTGVSTSQSCVKTPSTSVRNPPLSCHNADNSIGNFSTTSGGGEAVSTPTVLQSMCPPTMVLRRVLDEFVSLVASDDYGHMKENSNSNSGAAAGSSVASHWIGQVTVCTVHRAKGMEWPAVLLPGCWVGEYPVRTRSEEERRVFYVAMSRAMKHLVCFTASTRARGADTGHDDVISPLTDVRGGTVMAHDGSNALERTPYLLAVRDKLEHVAFIDLKQAYLKENGYI